MRCRTWQEVAARITDMTVRGAPAIGVTAAGGLALAAADAAAASPGDKAAFRAALEQAASGLLATRPTAVNLRWAVDEMRLVWSACDEPRPPARPCCSPARRRSSTTTSPAACASASTASALFRAGDTILTHCNAGALATAGYGTALGVVRAAARGTAASRVLVDETRPWLQGARLTAWELGVEGIPYRVISDNMAGHFIQRGDVDAVVVGADRIAANGDTANKIGTYTRLGAGQGARRAVLRRGAALHRRSLAGLRGRHPHRGARRGRGHLVPRPPGGARRARAPITRPST